MKPLDLRLLRMSRSARGFIVASAGTGLLRTIATIAMAWSLSAIVTEAIDAHRVAGLAERIGPSLALLALAFVVRAIAAWATDDLAGRAAARVKSELRRAALERTADRGPEWLAERSSAAFATALGPGLDALDAYFGRYVPQLVLTAIATPLLVVSIWIGDMTSGIIVLCCMPVIPIFMILIGLATQAVQREQADALSRLSAAFLEAVEGIGTLKVFGRARRQIDRIRTVTDDYRQSTIRVLRMSFVSGFALELAASLSVALVAVTIGVRLIDSSMGLGAALFVLVLAPEAFAPIRQVGADFHAAADGVEASAAVLDVLDEDAESAPVAAEQIPGTTLEPSTLILDDVIVRRPDVVVGPVNVEVRGGRVLALTGPSGGGKSSLLAAIRGVVPADGRFVLPSRADEDDATALITWMDQRPRLIRGTVAENVALRQRGGPGEIETVLAAFDAAGLDVDPARELGVGGTGLSGGQAQRVAFARAVYRVTETKTPLVLLDEPTSALDAEAERRVVATIRRMADDGAIVIVASHRPAVVEAADDRLELRPGGAVVLVPGNTKADA